MNKSKLLSFVLMGVIIFALTPVMYSQFFQNNLSIQTIDPKYGCLTSEQTQKYLTTLPHNEIVGFVHAVAKHSNGQVYSDCWNHNTRLVQGIQCMEFIDFSLNNGVKVVTNGTSDACQGLNVRGSTGWNGANVFFLVNGTTGSIMKANGSDTETTSKIGGTRASANSGIMTTATANEGGPQQASTIVPGSTSGTYNTITLTSPSFTFSATSGTNIRGAFLGNSTSATTANMFLENAFSSSVPVASGDSLTLTWAISIT